MSKVRVSPTQGLKAGDIVDYDDGKRQFRATVIKVTATTKAQIKPHSDVDDIFNSKNIINTYRLSMKIVK